MRTCIFGGPRTGKTTHANKLATQRTNAERWSRTGGDSRGDVSARHTDDLIGVLSWSEVSRKIADQWLTQPGPWIIEGVAVGRALRKWLEANPEGKPCDEVILMWWPHVELTSGQRGMAKGCATVWAEVEPELRARGVRVVEL